MNTVHVSLFLVRAWGGFRQAITCMTAYHKRRIIVSGGFALQELEEHTWSMLHNTNLNRKQGRYEKDLCTVALNVQL